MVIDLLGYYQGEGMYPREALKTLQKVGDVQNDIFDINIEMPEAKEKVEEYIDFKELAEDFKIQSYARLYSIEEIKAWLYRKNTPIPICIETENLVLKNNIIQPKKRATNSGHMMLVIGWNKNGFVVLNSWGEDWR